MLRGEQISCGEFSLPQFSKERVSHQCFLRTELYMNELNLLKTPIPAAYLLPVFVTVQEEAYLLNKIEGVGGVPIDDDDAGQDRIEGESSPRRFKSKPTGWKDVKGRR